jgi:histidinol-phosphatase (PHP family)
MKYMIGDSHLHTKESDGAYSVAEVIDFAIGQKLSYIYFTDHYPLPPELAQKATHGLSDAYVKEIEDAQKTFAGVIDICLGAEFDWLEDYADWTAQEIAKRNYDYILGSVHYIFDNKRKCGLIDANEEAFHEVVKQWGGVQNVVAEYYRQLRLMIKSGLFDGVAHFDLIKIYNKAESLFSEESDWYKHEVLATLDTLAESKMCMEINTNGWYKKCAVQYPSAWILKEAKKRTLSLTLSSDGHRGESVGRDLVKAAELAKSAGYRSIVRFKQRVMVRIALPYQHCASKPQ